MSDRPWYRRYGSDFIAGTLGLSLEEKGAYSIILDLIYDRRAPIPDDPRYIAGVCGCSVRRWNVIREKLLEAGKIALVDGRITNSRAEKELENDAKISRKRAENGRTGGEKRAENRAAANEINDIGEAKVKPRARVPEPEPYPEDTLSSISKKKSQRETRAEERASFAEFWSVYPHKVGKPAALKAWPRALASAGSLEAIIVGMRRYIAGKPPDRPWLNPASFLNQERWADQEAPANLAASTDPPPRVSVPRPLHPSLRRNDGDSNDDGFQLGPVLRGGLGAYPPQ